MSSQTPRTKSEHTHNKPSFFHHHYDGWTIAVVAVAVILPAIIIICTIFGINRDLNGFYMAQDIFAGVAFILGLLGLLLYAARVRKWSLPHALTLHGDGRETNVRLLTVSLIAVILPVVLVMLHHVL